MDWTDVCSAAELPPGASKEVVVAGRMVALFNEGGELFGLDGMCAHQGGPIAEGAVDGGKVTCPWHGWQYRLCDGRQALNPKIGQACFPVRIEADRILVGPPQPAEGPPGPAG